MEVNYPRAVLVGLAIALVLGVVVAASTSGAAFGAYNPAWDGASDLREIGTDAGADVEIVRNVGNDSAYAIGDPNDTIAVVLSPDQAYTPAEADRVRAFVEAGGTLLVAEDVGSRGNDLLAATGATARVDGGLLRDERNHFRAPALPVAGNVSEHNLTDGVEGLTLNYGTPVEPGAASTLVRTSEFGYVDRNGNEELDDAETLRSYPVVTVEPVGNGQVIAVGDPSLLINAMVEREGNRAFVENALGAHDRVLLDYSHTANIPPLRLALLVFRETPPLQALVGMLGVGGIALWVRGDTERLRDRLETIAARASVPGFDRTLARNDSERRPGLSRAELREYLAERHPEWDEDRIERVIRGVLHTEDEPTDQ
ncbi:MAG: DUF4350 domain-containing protein [Halobacteriales archaeon]